MKKKYLDIIEEVLAVLANHFVLIAAFMTLTGCFSEKQDFAVLWFASTIVPIVFYVLRKKVNNFPLFVLLHCFWPVIALAVSWGKGSVFPVLYFVLVTLQLIISIRMKMKFHKEMEIIVPLVAIVTFSVGMIMQLIWGVSEWSVYYMILVFAYFFCYYIYNYLHGYRIFMLLNHNSTANIPEKEIFTSGMTHTILFTVGGLGVLFLTSCVEWFAYIADIVGGVLIQGLRFLLSKIHFKPTYNEPVLGEDDMYTAGEKLQVEYESNPMYEDILLVVIKVFIVLLIILALVLLARAIILAWKDFTVNKASEEMMTAQNEVREKLDVKRKKKDNEGKGFFAFKDNKDKIRKYYKKRVTKEKVAILGSLDTENLKYKTASECCDAIDAEGLEKAYNKVRYSQEEITAEDVKLAKGNLD